MSTPWYVKRTIIARHDGQRRWDYVYQFLLQWALAREADSLSLGGSEQEDTADRRRLCPRVDQPSTPSTDD
jgi:hypothetical protein